MTLYKYLTSSTVNPILIELVRNRITSSTNVIKELKIFEDYLELTGREMDKWKSLSIRHNLSESTVKRILKKMKSRIK